MLRYILAVAALLAAPAQAMELTGTVSQVTDGDTFNLAGRAIRLCGIDAPERDEPGYFAAAAELEQIVAGQEVHCLQVSVGLGTPCDGRSQSTNRNRIVAQCFVGNADIADLLAEKGLVCDWGRFSGGHYSRNGGDRC